MICSLRVRTVSGKRGGVKGQKKDDKGLLKFCVVGQRSSGGIGSLKVKKALFKMISAFTGNHEAKLRTRQTTRGEACVTANISMSVSLVLMSADSLLLQVFSVSVYTIKSMTLFTSVYSIEIFHIHDHARFKD